MAADFVTIAHGVDGGVFKVHSDVDVTVEIKLPG